MATSVKKSGYIKAILEEGLAKGIIPNKTAKARAWYRNKAQQFRVVKEYALFHEQPERHRTFSRLMGIGSMYMFFYDAKTAAKLPWWDRFPLIFPFRKSSSGFWGLNLHYLPLVYRGVLMDGLYQITNNKKYDETTRLRLTATALNLFINLGLANNCIKRYLYTRVRSKLLYIHPTEWDIALFLPSERFMKQSKRVVWTATGLGMGKTGRISAKVQHQTRSRDLTPKTGPLALDKPKPKLSRRAKEEVGPIKGKPNG